MLPEQPRQLDRINELHRALIELVGVLGVFKAQPAEPLVIDAVAVVEQFPRQSEKFIAVLSGVPCAASPKLRRVIFMVVGRYSTIKSWLRDAEDG